MAIQKVIIKRDPDKAAGNQGNPRGTLLLRGAIDGVEMWATTDWEFMEKAKFLKEEERGLKTAFRKSFINRDDQFIIEYNDDKIEVIDKLKFNFVNKLIKLPDVRTVDQLPAHDKFWVVEFVGEVSLKKAQHIKSIGTVINMVNSMSYIQRKNICFFYEPNLQPHKLKNSQLYTKLLDFTINKDTNQPRGVLISSKKRIESVINDYYNNSKDNSFRTDVNKAISFGVIELSAGKGYYVDKQFIGIDNESVYAYLKTDINMYENYILPQLAIKDTTNDDDDDFVNVETEKRQAVDLTDYTTYGDDQLRDIAKGMGITRALNMQRPRLLKEIADVIAENKKKNEVAKEVLQD